MRLQSTNREVDTTCPWAGDCFGNMGCVDTCPPTLLDVLEDTARLEHELGMTHTDPEIKEVCNECR